MKKSLIISLLVVLMLPIFTLGCGPKETTPPPVPPLNGGQEAVLIEISTDEFMASNHITKNVEVTPPGSLIVSLGANPTTGFQWAEAATISDTAVIEQDSYNYVAPKAEGSPPMVGAPGKFVWVFNSLKKGTATIKMSYGRPWEGGEKDVWTLTINVTVK